jgi:hypothetical protein
VQALVKNNVNVVDWTKIETVAKCDKMGVEEEHLPKYVNVVIIDGEKKGYVVNGYPLGNGKKSCKKFTNRQKYDLDELYKLSIEYLEKLKIEFPVHATR